MFIVIPLKRERDFKHFFLLNFALLAIVLTPNQMELNLLHLHKKYSPYSSKRHVARQLTHFTMVPQTVYKDSPRSSEEYIPFFSHFPPNMQALMILCICLAVMNIW